MYPERGFVLPTAIFLLVVMAALGAFMVQLTSASQTASALDVQGARAVQAARVGIEAGLYSVHRQNLNPCPAGPNNIAAIPGLNGFLVSWTCASLALSENGVNRTVYTITSTACSPAGLACPSANAAAMQSNDYVERQLVVVTER